MRNSYLEHQRPVHLDRKTAMDKGMESEAPGAMIAQLLVNGRTPKAESNNIGIELGRVPITVCPV
jgi:hypothetical protein